MAAQFDQSSRLEAITTTRQGHRFAADVDAPGHPGFLQARGQVDRVTPDVICEPAGTDDSPSHRPRMNSNPQLQVGEASTGLGAIKHCQAQVDHPLGVLGQRLGETAHCHIGVADGFDLLQLTLADQVVEVREKRAQHGDHLGGIHGRGHGSKPHQVGEEDGDGTPLLVAASYWIGSDPVRRGDPRPQFLVAWLAAVLILFIPAALKLRHYLLPALPAAIWLGSLGQGCIRDLIRYGRDGVLLQPDLFCLPAIALVGAVPAIVMAVMLRRGAPLTPFATMALGGLAAAALGDFGLRLFHSQDASLMVLVWQFGTVFVLSVLAGWAGRYLLSWRSIIEPTLGRVSMR